jgi:all-trans-retinol dehydrogenase (NAD+)
MSNYKKLLEFAYHTLVILWLIAYYSIASLLKLIVPYTYRSKDVKGEIVLITGAGSGLGRLMAIKLAKLGAILVLIDVDEKSNKKTANEIVNDGGNAKAFTCDLSDRKAIYAVADEVY